MGQVACLWGRVAHGHMGLVVADASAWEVDSAQGEVDGHGEAFGACVLGEKEPSALGSDVVCLQGSEVVCLQGNIRVHEVKRGACRNVGEMDCEVDDHSMGQSMDLLA